VHEGRPVQAGPDPLTRTEAPSELSKPERGDFIDWDESWWRPEEQCDGLAAAGASPSHDTA
jgi:hypothetical protein